MNMNNAITPIPGIGNSDLSLSDQVYIYLVDRIVNGTINYGDSLNIKDLAAELHVSPMPIRDAIKKLELEGIAVVKPRLSCHVRTPTKKDVLQAVDARRMIELYVVSSIYRTVTREELEPIRRIVEEMRSDIRDIADRNENHDNARESYIARDTEFHRTLCGLMHNAYVAKFYRETSLHLSMRFRHAVGRRHSLKKTFHDHEKMLEQLEHNSPSIVTTMEEHLERSRDNIIHGDLFRTLEDT